MNPATSPSADEMEKVFSYREMRMFGGVIEELIHTGKEDRAVRGSL